MRMPTALKEAARRLHDETVEFSLRAVQERAGMAPPPDPHLPRTVVRGGGPAATTLGKAAPGDASTPQQAKQSLLALFLLGPESGGTSLAEDLLGCHLALGSRPETLTSAALAPFAAAARRLAEALESLIEEMSARGGAEGGGGEDGAMMLRLALRAESQGWLSAYGRFWILWEVWSRRGAHLFPLAGGDAGARSAPPPLCLSRDQSAACEQLVRLAQVREGAGVLGMLPAGLLPRRWPHPLLIGPAGSGKAFVIEEVARRLGRAVLRVEIASWIVVANRSARASLERIEEFLAAHPDGIVYLSGVDATSATRLGRESDGANLSWWNSVLGEIESFLDGAAAATTMLRDERQPPGGKTRPYVVVGGRFSALWGQADLGGPAGAEAWRLADARALAGPAAVAEWLEREGHLPAGVRGRLSSRALVISPVDGDEARELARHLCAALPPDLDGLVEVGAVAETLAGPEGWRGLAALIERRLATWTAMS